MLFGKKKAKTNQPPVMSEGELANRIGAAAGLLPEEIAKLLDSLAKVESDRVIIRQKSDKSKSGKKNRMHLAEAVELAHERAEERKQREELRRLAQKRKHLKYAETESREVIADDEYPQRLSPYDIGRSIEAAKTRLLEEEKDRNEKVLLNKKGTMILKVLDQMKTTEAARVARKIAQRQRRIGLLSLEESAYPEKIMTEQQELDPEVEENLEAARSLQSFGKGLNTLVDDAAEVVQTDYDAAASVMKQWVGHVNSEDS